MRQPAGAGSASGDVKHPEKGAAVRKLSRTVWILSVVVWGSTVVLLGTARDVVIPRVPTTIPDTDLSNLPGDLAAVAVPRPANLSEFVRDEGAAVRPLLPLWSSGSGR